MMNASNAYGVAHFAPTPHINNLKWDNIDVIGGMLDMMDKERNYQLAQDKLGLDKERLGLDRDTLDWHKDDAIAKRLHDIDLLNKNHANAKELAELQGKINLKVADKHNYAYSLRAKMEQDALDRANLAGAIQTNLKIMKDRGIDVNNTSGVMSIFGNKEVSDNLGLRSLYGVNQDLLHDIFYPIYNNFNGQDNIGDQLSQGNSKVNSSGKVRDY